MIQQTSISIPHDQEFKEKLLWQVDSPEKAKLLFHRIRRQANLVSLSTALLDEHAENGGLYIPGVHTVVFGTKDRIEGFMAFSICSPAKNIGSISMLDGLDGSQMTNLDGELVTRSNLSRHEGYCRYTGAGSVCHLDLISTLCPGQGIGSIGVQYLQASRDFELIELEANGTGQSEFFRKQGFVDTGIDPAEGEQLSMVWNNPIYSRGQ